ncbi:MAG TPA: DUF547 domain-containing protein [Solimonas sp.]|nr:DUF547 domain-containing protein [Solimonas sp.]
MSWKKITLAAWALGVTACASIEPPPSVPASVSQTSPTISWERVLQYRVDDRGHIDFVGLAGDRSDLDRVVSHVYAHSPRDQPSLYPAKSNVLAYHLNAYNALAMYQVLDAGVPDSIGGFRKLRFFGRSVQVGGQPTTLKEYKDQIRKLGDPRVHFALNDMVIGSPRLARRPFKAELLNQQLDIETRYFFVENRNVRVDDKEKTVYLSELLDMYSDDFLQKAPSLVAYVNQYRDAKVPESYKVRFIPFDWSVNQRR